MSKKMLSMLAVCALATVVTTAQACPCSKSKSAGKTKTVADKTSTPCSKSAGAPCHKGSAKLVASKANSHIEELVAKLPKMQYKVGDTVTVCSKSASTLAEKSHEKMLYLVGDKSFENEAEAKAALAAELEKEIANLESMQFAVGEKCVRCPITAKSMAKESGSKVAYRVAGIDFLKKEQAEKAVALVSDAAETVKISYKVGEKSFCCDKMAGDYSKETGKSITYVVGDEETSCPITAKLMLNKAKIHAIIAAAAAALAS